ncbi:hypothetical protein WME98_00800 [Sorangium sp. So ce296]|uniref:hypothetical protein n=1 Tax=Sorangium sp. So ce296 TaxID=3133296 RepID=UPI003F61588F
MYKLGIHRVPHELFNHLKADDGTVYVMGIQLRLRSNLFVVGELHNFELEALAAYPLLIRSCGGIVPSLEPPYRDGRCFDAPAIDALEALMAARGKSTRLSPPSPGAGPCVGGDSPSKTSSIRTAARPAAGALPLAARPLPDAPGTLACAPERHGTRTDRRVQPPTAHLRCRYAVDLQGKRRAPGRRLVEPLAAPSACCFAGARDDDLPREFASLRGAPRALGRTALDRSPATR